MIDLSTKSLLVWDNGLFLSFALRMAQKGGFGHVLYYNDDRRRGRPSFQECSVGKGYSQIEVVKSPWRALDRADAVAFPDVMDWEAQVWLREQGIPVWGAAQGAELELYRYYAKKIMEAVGLPVGPYVLIKGVPALRDYLKKNQNQVLKVSYVRGLMESRKHLKWWLSKNFIDGLEYRLGPLAEEQEFIVEEIIDSTIEIGGDQIFVKQFPKIAINGAEIKDRAYLGCVQRYEDLPDELREVNDALAPVLAKCGYANFFSTEGRKAKDGTFYPIDLTCRQGSPSGEAQLAVWTNLPQIVWAGAHGEHLEPEYGGKWVAQAMMFNKGDDADWCPVSIPKENEADVRLYYSMKKGDEHYVIPQVNGFDEIGSVVQLGDTREEAVERCKALCKRIEGHIDIHTEALDEAVEEFDRMEKKGMNVEPIAA